MHAVDTVVISAAGMGTRLGLNLPKSLVEVEGKPMIAHQLEMLDEVESVVVVVGYRARAVVDVVLSIRPEALIAFNHAYASTGTAASLSKGAAIAGPRVIALDGDLLVDRNDFYRFLALEGSVAGLVRPTTGKPVYAHLDDASHIVHLTQEHSAPWEWCGLLNVERSVVLDLGSQHVFSGLREHLPMRWMEVDCVEIDDPQDLDRARDWLRDKGDLHG